MITLQETTKWDKMNSGLINHTYLVNDTKEKMFGYIKSGSDELVMFEKPLNFHTKGRTFKKLGEVK